MVLAVGVILAAALFGRLACLRREHPPGAVQPLAAAAQDSIGGWVDRGDSILNVDATADSLRTRAGFDLWARALCSCLAPAADTLPGERVVRAKLDSLNLPGEVARGLGSEAVIGVTFRPRSAIRLRSAYAFYVDHGRVGALPLGLDNASNVRFAGWRENDTLNVAVAGIKVLPQGPRPVLKAYRLDTLGNWMPWDSLPPPDSLGSSQSVPSFDQRPGSPPLLVVRSYSTQGLFDECAQCPHRYVDRILQLAGGKATWFADQGEDTPYGALVGFLEALARGDRDGAALLAMDRSVVDAAQADRLDESSGERSWRLLPGQQMADTALTATRRGAETYLFRLRYDAGHWRVSAINRNDAAATAR